MIFRRKMYRILLAAAHLEKQHKCLMYGSSMLKENFSMEPHKTH